MNGSKVVWSAIEPWTITSAGPLPSTHTAIGAPSAAVTSKRVGAHRGAPCADVAIVSWKASRVATHWSGWVACGMCPAPAMVSTCAAGTSNASSPITAENKLGLSVPEVNISGTVVAARAAASIDPEVGSRRSSRNVGALASRIGPEGLGELRPRSRPERHLVDEMLGGGPVVARLDQGQSQRPNAWSSDASTAAIAGSVDPSSRPSSGRLVDGGAGHQLRSAGHQRQGRRSSRRSCRRRGPVRRRGARSGRPGRRRPRRGCRDRRRTRCGSGPDGPRSPPRTAPASAATTGAQPVPSVHDPWVNTNRGPAPTVS